MPAFPPMELNQVYFYTATILRWQPLLYPEEYKQIIIDSLRHLSKKKKIAVYGFVIMPNHIHLIWEMLDKNGKEMPNASFMKYTSHCFLANMRKRPSKQLYDFLPNQSDRNYHFWQRNSLPVILYTKSVAVQKLYYTHRNPVAGKWRLVDDFKLYPYSSAAFYMDGGCDFGFLVDYRERFGYN